ncbi:hypothetical protein GUJ93_ZPchr0012g21714 [Zizania palustris]|uniref:Uncharacterized protein n=1 Tax=Zizania palustris TaxID=103762 RepID=A0A8J6BQE2_ZIZPA|nr:hypothetical protein GUJ93_ZPchr0012g21714 [Zizania palustris]
MHVAALTRLQRSQDGSVHTAAAESKPRLGAASLRLATAAILTEQRVAVSFFVGATRDSEEAKTNKAKRRVLYFFRFPVSLRVAGEAGEGGWPCRRRRRLRARSRNPRRRWCFCGYVRFRGGLLALGSPTSKGLPHLQRSVGIYGAFKFHSESGIANLYRLHSCLQVSQRVFGFATFFSPGAAPTLG